MVEIQPSARDKLITATRRLLRFSVDAAGPFSQIKRAVKQMDAWCLNVLVGSPG